MVVSSQTGGSNHERNRENTDMSRMNYRRSLGETRRMRGGSEPSYASTWRDGRYWIGNLPVKVRQPLAMVAPKDGLFFNLASGCFEVLREGIVVSAMSLDTDWKKLAMWASRCGFRP